MEKTVNIAKKIEAELSDDKLAFVKGLGARAVSSGCRIYLVGGTVRDLLLGRDNIDIDIAVEGDAIKLGRSVAKETGAELSAYKSFGTCTLSFGGALKVDLATARRESYSRPGAMPTVKPGSLKEDLKRRDFTINAIAASVMPKDFGRLYDPFGGVKDIRSGVIRALHPRSFVDDPTRIFRARRFAARFGFRIDGRTDELMKKALIGRALDTVSQGRIQKELMLISKEIL
jgi:tRNA nucleotidyltransferase (CCA-adding enzyme)